MNDLKKTQTSSFLKLRESTSDSSRLVNNRGDFVKVYSPTRINVNGNTHRSANSAAKAISLWGKK